MMVIKVKRTFYLTPETNAHLNDMTSAHMHATGSSYGAHSNAVNFSINLAHSSMHSDWEPNTSSMHSNFDPNTHGDHDTGRGHWPACQGCGYYQEHLDRRTLDMVKNHTDPKKPRGHHNVES